ncbi:long-chain acyl-CoA synthetase [Actinoplanes lutulentus]|uniref:Long-chain acyl-CoA synthetase n=1 Tax=Actinoplanes lutulentus TaxID=1287878 RepID=A0A327Z1X8_9ACTN|nr:long-chain fatty acid--CoA ligase [Actinoplanes lutulentus]MBB2943358.1 long-chain acyl-CoA synthetase [Actinoplanes lutulentus]RAK28416.1 long-chain acyl-CoA synthetase [Actinoplanes lutulentus]
MSAHDRQHRLSAPATEVAAWERLWQTAPASLGALLAERVARTPDAEAYRWPDPDGEWRSQTWAQAGLVAREIAAGLLALGLRPQDRVAVMSGTRVEWIHADLGVMCAGGATTTVYPTSTAEDVSYILADSDSRIAVVENAGYLDKVLAAGSPVEHAVLIDGADPRALTLAELRGRGRALLEAAPDAVTAATSAVGSDQLATLIYTSGTTGRPKGVRLPHRCWIYEGLAGQAIELAGPDDLGYLWLPLAHAFGKALIATQIAIGYPCAVDGDLTRIIGNLPLVRPTVMPAVPRIFEKVHAGVLAAAHRDGGLKARLFDWAVDAGRQAARTRRAGQRPAAWPAVRHRIADRLVLARIRARFGGRMRYFISGAAALSADIAEFFDALGLPVLEGYGLTESSAATVVNRLGTVEYGTVGVPFPGTVIAIADDGEILIKGPGVMTGYHGGDEVDGWLSTGDIGEITARGSLKITDRKKDLIKTSGGKYVAPQSIETRFAAICPLSAQIVVHGEGRKYITALIDLDPQAVRSWAKEHDVPGADHAELVRSPQLVAVVERYIAELNAGLGRWETIKQFAILGTNLTVENGDLTPSLKVRRRVVEQRHGDLLDTLYPG